MSDPQSQSAESSKDGQDKKPSKLRAIFRRKKHPASGSDPSSTVPGPSAGEESDTGSITKDQINSACNTILENLSILTMPTGFEKKRFKKFCRLTPDNPVPYDFHGDKRVWYPSRKELDSWINQVRSSRKELADALSCMSRWMYPQVELDPVHRAELLKIELPSFYNGPSDAQEDTSKEKKKGPGPDAESEEEPVTEANYYSPEMRFASKELSQDDEKLKEQADKRGKRRTSREEQLKSEECTEL